ncbi:DUF397 domain-containing protein [Streptomyces sp. NPDC057654]|uniref:DUF397 domain-containing protein n=1 Tax=Streptomyces sp. NPDC057654 TaxID=3346196 RepID=UPI003694B788
MPRASSEIPEDAWFKSSYSGANTTECVEASFLPDGILVRDSKDSGGPVLSFDGSSWLSFVIAARAGKLR